MTRINSRTWAFVALAATLLAAGAGHSACQGYVDRSSQSSFDKPYDDTWFKGRRD